MTIRKWSQKMNKNKRILIISGVLIFALAVSAILIFTGPRVRKKKPDNKKSYTHVNVSEMKAENVEVVVEATGKVAASRIVIIQPRVSGKVIWKNSKLIPGGIVKKGQHLIKIDPADYKLAVKNREADLSNAVLNMNLEKGKQGVAQKEYKMLGKDLTDDEKKLVLREYYGNYTQKSVVSAQASLERAENDLARTVIAAPFNSVVVENYSEVGSVVSTGSQIVKIAGSDSYWVLLSVPVEKIKWIEVPGKNTKGSSVKIYSENVWGKDVYRTGEVVRIGADLQDNGYMSKVIVRIDDPLSLKKENSELPKLIIGMYLNAEITGKTIEKSIKIPRTALRENDTIYFTGDDMKMMIESPEILFKGRNDIIVSADDYNGKYLVVGTVSSPAKGIPLKILAKTVKGEVKNGEK